MRSVSVNGGCCDHFIATDGFHSPALSDSSHHVRICHHRRITQEKASLRGQHSVHQLAVFQRTACPKAIYPKCRCRRSRAEGYRKQHGMLARLLTRSTSLTPRQPGSSEGVSFVHAEEELLLVRH